MAKAKPCILTRQIKPSDWEELGYINLTRPNVLENW